MTSVLPRNPTLKTAETSNFESLWGESTRWKSSVPRSRRLDVYHPIPDNIVTSSQPVVQLHSHNTDNANPTSVARRPPPDLNKPLPPLPVQALVSDQERSIVDHTLRRRSTVSRSLISSSTMGNMYHDAKRIATLALNSKKRKSSLVPVRNRSPLEDQNEARKVSRPLQDATDMVQLTSGPEHIATQITLAPAAPLLTSHHLPYVNHGTQSEPTSKSSGVDSADAFKYFVIRPALLPSISLASSHRSPKNVVKRAIASDYFQFQAEDIKGHAAPSARHRSGHLSNTSKSSSSGTASTGQISATSVGTYESKYSATESAVRGVIHQARPSHSRSASDSTFTVKQHLSLQPQASITQPSGTQWSQSRRANLRGSLDETSRPKKHFPKSTATRPLQQHIRSGHISESSSPLRQEMTVHREEAEPLPATPDSAVMFRVPVSHVKLAEEPMYTVLDVPEHLAGSPLCPLNPKHKSYGLGMCPFHGRLTFADSHDAAESTGENGAAQSKSSGAIDDEAFKLIVPQHNPDSVKCPANPKSASGGKGVCVYHGRARPMQEERPRPSQRLSREYVWT